MIPDKQEGLDTGLRFVGFAKALSLGLRLRVKSFIQRCVQSLRVPIGRRTDNGRAPPTDVV